MFCSFNKTRGILHPEFTNVNLGGDGVRDLKGSVDLDVGYNVLGLQEELRPQ